ncbi:MAG TPA: AAA-like domain-containing protein [Rhodothermales bacterium]|nr:AAA-like domain-containing protein [Rhodothermales bacterium]
MEEQDRMIGRAVSDYKVLEKLGGGGMGVVYKAHHEKLGRHAALKFLMPAMSGNDIAKERFAIEARAASALDHPNICAIYDIDQTDSGQIYIAMAYYDGESLKSKLARGPLQLEEALDYAVQMAEGLSKAHAGGIVHRDIKPANVMITTEGVVKLVDFGVAKMGDMSLTESGTTVGTMAYMSPEQLQGEESDHQADIWALGCVIHEMLSGSRPFVGAYPQAVGYAIINGDRTPLSESHPGVPEAMERIVAKCLERDLTKRYDSAAAVFADLYRARRQLRDTDTQISGIGRQLSAQTKRSRVFVSYKRGTPADEQLAHEISSSLGDSHDVFLDKMILVGSKWIEQLETEIARADYMIVLLSADSVHSEMVVGEIEMANRFAASGEGRPRILPVRVNYSKPFTYPLSHYLDELNWASWNGEVETESLVSTLAQAISKGSLESSPGDGVYASPSGEAGSIPVPVASAQPVQLEMPEGTMDPESHLYVSRPADAVALSAATRQGVTLTIKGPRQMGKSSLLMRTMAAAAQAGKQVVFLDFQLFDASALGDADTFFKQFCTWLTDELDLEDAVDEYWRRPLGNSQRCTRYVGRHILKQVDQPIFLAMDEVERVFDTDFRSDFFSMLRSWHNDRAIKSDWKNLDLALVTSTEPYQLIENLNQSPFNVGEVIALQDFTREQVAMLNGQHGSPFDKAELGTLNELLAGHPYLVRKALFLVAGGRLESHELFRTAAQEHGPFGDHLRYHLFRLHGHDDLIDGFRQVIRQGRCADEGIFWRLRGAGLVKREGNEVVPRCALYRDYFQDHLDV